MASYVLLGQIIDSVNRQIDRYRMSGTFYCEFMPWLLQWQTVYCVEYKYLSVKDRFVYDDDQIKQYYTCNDCEELIRDFLGKLKEIKKQFEFYFEGIWG